MTDLQAALGRSQIEKLDEFVNRRRQIVSEYNQRFANNPFIKIPYQLDGCDSSWHIYVIQLNLENLVVGRKEIFEALIAENIGVNVHYIPVHLHPYYQNLGYKRGIAPTSEWLYERILTLPLFPAMIDQDVEDVIAGVEKVLSYYG